jgi:hypothetical protein
VARTLARLGRQPDVVQSDRGACFVGAEAASAAIPNRLTLWLWSLGIAHRLTPPRRPQRNGAVERLHGALEHSWTGEADGVAALLAVWNHGKQVATPATTPYSGRDGSDLDRVWAGLAEVTVQRRVTRQGTTSLWDRPVRIGKTAADTVVTVTFQAERRVLVARDAHDAIVREIALPWLTLDWLWEDIPVTDHLPQTDDTSMRR